MDHITNQYEIDRLKQCCTKHRMNYPFHYDAQQIMQNIFRATFTEEHLNDNKQFLFA